MILSFAAGAAAGLIGGTYLGPKIVEAIHTGLTSLTGYVRSVAASHAHTAANVAFPRLNLTSTE